MSESRKRTANPTCEYEPMVRRSLAAALKRPAAALVVAGVLLTSCGGEPTKPPAQVARGTVFAACGTNDGAGVLELNGELVLTAGVKWDSTAVTGADDVGFGDLVIDDGEIVQTKTLCITQTESTDEILCEGYFSQAVLDAIEQTGTIEAARELLRGNIDFPLYDLELSSGGSSAKVRAVDLDVMLVDLASGEELDQTELAVQPTCPTERSRFEGNLTALPTTAHLEAIAEAFAE